MYECSKNNTMIIVDNEIAYSQNSCRRPPKMSSLGGCLREEVPYESLDHIESHFASFKTDREQCVCIFFFCSCEKSILRKNPVLKILLRNFHFCTTWECDNVATPYYLFLLNYLSGGHLGPVYKERGLP